MSNKVGTGFISFHNIEDGNKGEDGYTPIKGVDYFDGQDGQDGSDGSSSFLWVRYSQNSDGSNMTESPVDAKYVGLATTTTPDSPTLPSAYEWSLIKGEQGIKGEVGEDGRTSYLHIKYSDDGTTFTPNNGETVGAWIGTYVDFEEVDSSTFSRYTWNKVRGEDGYTPVKGTDYFDGQDGQDGESSYLWIRYSQSSTGANMTTDPANAIYIGVATTTANAAPLAASDYKWSLVKGEKGDPGLRGIQGEQGDQGIKGETGADGKTSYTHIAYANNDSGTLGFSVSDSLDKTYIGMYTDFSATDSDNPADYKWTLVKGADGSQGIPGPTGENGKTPYLHIAYATNDTGTEGFSTTVSEGKTYIGTYTDFLSADSETPSKYTWALIKGEKGDRGDRGVPGEVGPDGRTSYLHIKYSNNGTSFTANNGEDVGAWIGTYVDFEPLDSTTFSDYTWNKVKGADGYTPVKGTDYFDGEDGQDGVSSYLWVRYSVNSNGNPMTTTPVGAKYIGTATTTTPTAPASYTAYTWVLVKGDQGVAGEVGPDGRTSYLHIKYSDNGTTFTANGGETVGAYIGTYVDFSPTDSTVFSAYTWNKVRGEDGYTPVKGTDYFDGKDGQKGDPGADGTSSYLWVRYSQNANGNPMTDSPTNAKYIGIATTTTASAPISYSSYSWSLVKGTDGVKGETGANGQTSYLHIKYSNDGGATFTANSGESVGDWIGTYVDFTAADSNSVGAYTWNKVKGEKGDKGDVGPRGLTGLEGPQGDQGIPGPKGTDGKSSYTHIAYATSATGANFSTSHFASATYIGMYVDQIATDSDTPSVYKWSLIKGADGSQGIPGPTGNDGKTSYLHIAYANNATGSSGFSTTVSDGKLYIGQYTDFLSADSEDPTKYKWTLIKGDKGDKGDTGARGATGLQGPTGPTGTSVTGVVEYYLATSAASGVTTATTGWGTSMQSMTTTNKYLWNYEKINFSDGSSQNTIPVIMGVYGDTGPQGSTGGTGATGRSITGVTEYYLASASASGITRSTGGWTTAMQVTTPTLKYLWNYEVINWSSGTATTYVEPIIIGIHGDKGDKGDIGPQGPRGIEGPRGSDGTSQYVHIRYSANSNGSSMTTTPQSNTAYVGIANTTSSTAPGYTGFTWSLFKGPQGATGGQGVIGPKGADGQTTYTWVKYADDENGSGMADTPSGKRYIGLAFNKTTPTESNSASLYSWSPLYDNVKVGGRNYWAIIKEPWHSYLNHEGSGVFSNTGTTSSFAIFRMDLLGIPTGETYTASFEIKVSDAIIQFSNNTFYVNGGSPSTTHNRPTLVKDKWVKVYATFEYTVENTGLVHIYIANIPTANSLEFRNFQVEKGNIATDYTQAPEDIQAVIDEKAATDDLENLGKIVSDVSSLINLKAGMGEFEAMQEAFNTRVAQDIIDKKKLSEDLATIEGRTVLVEEIAGDSKKITEFIDTVITSSDEGIFIANGSTSTGILIGTDRISFMDNDTEVAYISNQTMQINHGIFVESATISNFKFELIPGTTILGITWVGED